MPTYTKHRAIWSVSLYSLYLYICTQRFGMVGIKYNINIWENYSIKAEHTKLTGFPSCSSRPCFVSPLLRKLCCTGSRKCGGYRSSLYARAPAAFEREQSLVVFEQILIDRRNTAEVSVVTLCFYKNTLAVRDRATKITQVFTWFRTEERIDARKWLTARPQRQRRGSGVVHIPTKFLRGQTFYRLLWIFNWFSLSTPIFQVFHYSDIIIYSSSSFYLAYFLDKFWCKNVATRFYLSILFYYSS